jgi:hypothetical protein
MYLTIILTGVLINKYGLMRDVLHENIFSWLLITLGTLSFIKVLISKK